MLYVRCCMVSCNLSKISSSYSVVGLTLALTSSFLSEG